MQKKLMTLAALGAVALGLWWAHQQVASRAIEEAVDAARLQWNEKVVADQAEANKLAVQVTAVAATKALEVQRESEALLSKAATDLAAHRGERERLQHEISRLRARAVAAAGDPKTSDLAHGAAAAAVALGQCSAEYERVAGVADELSVKVSGLQGYVELTLRACSENL